jgi:hypothetical protein
MLNKPNLFYHLTLGQEMLWLEREDSIFNQLCIAYLLEEFEDTKWVIGIHISKKSRHHNGQKDKQRSTKHTYKTKDRVTRTRLKTGIVPYLNFKYY